jgi:hypothetical protein
MGGRQQRRHGGKFGGVHRHHDPAGRMGVVQAAHLKVEPLTVDGADPEAAVITS